MELSFNPDNEPEKQPEFFNLDDEIRKLVESTELHKEEVIKVETDYATKHNEIIAKIEALRAKLVENNTTKYKILDKARQQVRRGYGSASCAA